MKLRTTAKRTKIAFSVNRPEDFNLFPLLHIHRPMLLRNRPYVRNWCYPPLRNCPYVRDYERSLNFEVLALKQIGLIYFIPGHRSGLFKFFLCDYHTYSTKHCITLAVGLLSLLLFIIIVSKLRFSLPFVLFCFILICESQANAIE